MANTSMESPKMDCAGVPCGAKMLVGACPGTDWIVLATLSQT
jgi:hypothetical protein